MLKWFLKVCAHVGSNNINTRKFLNRHAIHACMHHAGKKIKQSRNICQQCGKKYQQSDAKEWVGCDHCWRWWHYKCLGLTRKPRKKDELKCIVCQKDHEKNSR